MPREKNPYNKISHRRRWKIYEKIVNEEYKKNLAAKNPKKAGEENRVEFEIFICKVKSEKSLVQTLQNKTTGNLEAARDTENKLKATKSDNRALIRAKATVIMRVSSTPEP